MKNQCYSKEHEQKFETWIGNQTRNTNKKSETTSKNGKTVEGTRIL